MDTPDLVTEGVKAPSHGKSPLGGYPSPLPQGINRQDFSVKLAKKLNGKGGYPLPPLTDPNSKKFSPQAAFFCVFDPKKTLFLAQKVNEKS